LKKLYRYGIKGDVNDAETFLQLIYKFYTDANSNFSSTKQFMTRMGTSKLAGMNGKLAEQHKDISHLMSVLVQYRHHLILTVRSHDEGERKTLLKNITMTIDNILITLDTLGKILPSTSDELETYQRTLVGMEGSDEYISYSEMLKEYLKFINNNIPNFDWIEPLLTDFDRLMADSRRAGVGMQLKIIYERMYDIITKINGQLGVDPVMLKIVSRGYNKLMALNNTTPARWSKAGFTATEPAWDEPIRPASIPSVKPPPTPSRVVQVDPVDEEHDRVMSDLEARLNAMQPSLSMPQPFPDPIPTNTALVPRMSGQMPARNPYQVPALPAPSAHELARLEGVDPYGRQPPAPAPSAYELARLEGVDPYGRRNPIRRGERRDLTEFELPEESYMPQPPRTAKQVRGIPPPPPGKPIPRPPPGKPSRVTIEPAEEEEEFKEARTTDEPLVGKSKKKSTLKQDVIEARLRRRSIPQPPPPRAIPPPPPNKPSRVKIEPESEEEHKGGQESESESELMTSRIGERSGSKETLSDYTTVLKLLKKQKGSTKVPVTVSDKAHRMTQSQLRALVNQISGELIEAGINYETGKDMMKPADRDASYALAQLHVSRLDHDELSQVYMNARAILARYKSKYEMEGFGFTDLVHKHISKPIYEKAIQFFKNMYKSTPVREIPTRGVVKSNRIEGYGVRMRGCGLGGMVDTSQGIQPSPSYIRFGKYLINAKKLNNNIVSLRRDKGSTIKTIPTRMISPHLGTIMKKIVGGGMPSYDDLNKLTDDEKQYLHRVTQESDIFDKLAIPTPSKDKEEQDAHQFNVLKGEIMAGNNSKEVITKFKLLVLKLSKQGILPKNQVQEILEELLELGL